MIKIIQIVNLIVSIGIVIYILADTIIKRKQLKENKIERIKNNKYTILISIIIALFFIYGILRNFE